jgi:hypothetical protein
MAFFSISRPNNGTEKSEGTINDFPVLTERNTFYEYESRDFSDGDTIPCHSPVRLAPLYFPVLQYLDGYGQ